MTLKFAKHLREAAHEIPEIANKAVSLIHAAGLIHLVELLHLVTRHRLERSILCASVSAAQTNF